MNKLKYLGYSVVFQEVPNEVSLAINVSGCPYKCRGCHSKFLWEDRGDVLVEHLNSLIEHYKGLISCVCFMGGDQNTDDLMTCIGIVKEHGLKTCLYTGLDEMGILLPNILDSLDYIKVGRYIEELGGLDSDKTNQRFYKKENGTFNDITYMFKKTRRRPDED